MAEGAPSSDRLEECQGISGTALVAQQLGKARGGAQFPGEGALPARPAELDRLTIREELAAVRRYPEPTERDARRWVGGGMHRL